MDGDGQSQNAGGRRGALTLGLDPLLGRGDGRSGGTES